MQERWELWKLGGFNEVYRNAARTLIFKRRRRDVGAQFSQTDDRERSVRVWNEINPNFPAFLHTDALLGDGWVCPLIAGKPASDIDTCEGLIEVYNDTGRIVSDAPSSNFIKLAKKEVVCIDVGFAWQLEERAGRRQSIISLDEWSKEEFYQFGSYYKQFEGPTAPYIHTIQVIKSLLFIKRHAPDLTDCSFLMNPTSREEFANAYHYYIRQRALSLLDTEQDIANIRYIIRALAESIKKEPDSRLNNIIDEFENNISVINRFENPAQRDNVPRKKEYESAIKFFTVYKQQIKRLFDINKINRHVEAYRERLREISRIAAIKKLVENYINEVKRLPIEFQECPNLNQIERKKALYEQRIQHIIRRIRAECSQHIVILNSHQKKIEDVLNKKKEEINQEVAKQILEYSDFNMYFDRVKELHTELVEKEKANPKAYGEAVRSAKGLMTLMDISSKDFINSKIPFHKLKTICLGAIEKSLDVFEEHRGYKQVLLDVANFFASLFTLGIPNAVLGRWRLFSTPTHSAEVTQNIYDGFEKITVTPS